MLINAKYYSLFPQAPICKRGPAAPLNPRFIKIAKEENYKRRKLQKKKIAKEENYKRARKEEQRKEKDCRTIKKKFNIFQRFQLSLFFQSSPVFLSFSLKPIKKLKKNYFEFY
jgi:hypothetical protein